LANSSINPENQKAKDGIASVEKIISGGDEDNDMTEEEEAEDDQSNQ
jgi:hypothetical protein